MKIVRLGFTSYVLLVSAWIWSDFVMFHAHHPHTAICWISLVVSTLVLGSIELERRKLSKF